MPIDRSSERVGRIGSADVGAILGLNPYRSALDVWQTIRGEYQADLSEVLRVSIGRDLEALGLEEYSRRTGRSVERIGTLTHPKKPHLSATPDGYDREAKAVVEVKCTFARWYVPPEYYWCQVRWQALLMNANGYPVETLSFVVIRLGGFAPVVEFFNDDDPKHTGEFDLVSQWWDRHVVTETPPKGQAESLDDGSLVRQYPDPGSEIAEVNGEVADTLRAYQTWRARREFASAQEREAKARLCDEIGRRKVKGLELEGVGRVTWARRKGSARVSWEKVARALDAPDRLIDEHTKITTGSRSFRFTAAKPAETTKEG